MGNDKVDKRQTIWYEGRKHFIKDIKKNDDGTIVITLSGDYCTGLPWPPTGGECQGPYEPYNNNGEICCRFGAN